jgi:hypothetical protein
VDVQKSEARQAVYGRTLIWIFQKIVILSGAKDPLLLAFDATPRCGILKITMQRATNHISRLTLLLFLALAGCGSTTYPSVTGTWSFAAINSATPSEPPQTLTGTLTSNGTNVSGTLTYSNPCFKGVALAYSGSFSSGNALKLTSAAYANQVVTLNGTISTDGTLLTQGDYTVAAQNSSPAICDIADSGTLTGSRTATTP